MAYCGKVKWFNKQYGFINHQGASYERTSEALSKLCQHLKDTNKWDGVDDDLKQEIQRVTDTDKAFPEEIFVHRTAIKLNANSDMQILLPNETVSYDIDSDPTKPEGKQNSATNVKGAHKAYFNHPMARRSSSAQGREYGSHNNTFVPVQHHRPGFASGHAFPSGHTLTPQDYMDHIASIQRSHQYRQYRSRTSRRQRNVQPNVEPRTHDQTVDNE